MFVVAEDKAIKLPPLDERPLVTFALFAYNQEEYIRKAIEAAFAQTYVPLEIVLSDDCSTDNTFAIMKMLAADYKGPHSVMVRKTEKNLGTLQHLAEVAQKAKGGLLVLAAGDDVSKPERVSLMVRYWVESGAWGICSRYDRIGSDGKLLEINLRPSVLDNHGFERFFYPEEGTVNVVHGCSSAYDMRVFSYLELNEVGYILSEDGAISVLLNLLGKKILHLDESLVFYRETSDSLTNSPKKHALTLKEIKCNEQRIRLFSQSQANRCKLFYRMNLTPNSYVRQLNINEVKLELGRQESIINWFCMPFYKRLFIVLSGQLNSRWAVPRLFGREFFYVVKFLASRIK